MNKSLAIALVICALVNFGAHAQDDGAELLLRFKRVFADAEIAALKEPYVGITTSTGLKSGLFPIRSTGVSTEAIRIAAEKFLAALTPARTLKTIFDVEDPEWTAASTYDRA